MPSGTTARTWLLAFLFAASTLALAPSAPAQDAEPPFELTDPPGDLQPAAFPVGPAPTPATAPTPVTDAADLVALQVIDETPTRLDLALVVNSLSGTAHNQDAKWTYSYHVIFGIEGSPVTYQIVITWFGLYNGAAGDEIGRPDGSANMCLRNPDDANNPFCHYQPIEFQVDLENARFVFKIPKASMLGIDPTGDGKPLGTPQRLPAGTNIIDWQARSEMRSLPLLFAIAGAFVYLQDSLPDTGPSDDQYPLQHTAANSEIALRGPRNDETDQPVDVAVLPDRPTSVTVSVENKQSSKRLVNLTAAVADGATGWDAQIAPAVELPARSTRTVTLLVNASTSLSHLDAARIEVTARSIGHPEEIGFATVRAFAAVPPTPDMPVLHFHAGANESFQTICFSVPPGLCQADEVWLNTLADDPRADRDDAATEGSTILGLGPFDESMVFRQQTPMDTPLARPVFLDPDQGVRLTAAFQADVGFEGRLEAHLAIVRIEPCGFFGLCTTYEPIGSGETTGTVGTDPSPFDVTFAVNPQYTRIDPTDGRLGVVFELYSQDPQSVAPETTGLAFVSAESQVTLPLIPNPEGESDGPTLIGLYPASDEEEFVNPGKTRVFNVLLVNEGVETDRLALEAQTSGDAWSTELRPGDKFQLKPGESVNATILVTAPDDAAEGETVNVTVTAQSLIRTDDRRSLAFRAIATEGVDIEDEAESYEVAPEDRDKVFADETPESPGLGVLALLVALVAGAAVHRCARRR